MGGPPGTSEHQTGLALDIVAASYQLLDERQEDTAEQKWLMENSWKYGFILRYPRRRAPSPASATSPGTTDTWAEAAAAEIYRTGVCLEEYLGRAVLPAAELTPARRREAEAPAVGRSRYLRRNPSEWRTIERSNGGATRRWFLRKIPT